MRRRLTFLSALVAWVLVLVLPGTALGATYTYVVTEDTCNASGGDYGYGELHFSVKLTEYSRVANKFTFAGNAQHREIGSTRWRNDWNFGTFSYWFASNGTNNNYTRWFKYHPGDFAWHRMKVVLKVWHNGTLLARKTVYGDYC